MSKTRGFEVVKDEFRQHKAEQPSVVMDEKILIDGKKFYVPEVKTPQRADVRSAGYDFYLVNDVKILPGRKTLIWTDIKAYMQEDEVLKLFIRSSLGVKQGLMLSNQTGIIDSSYYENEGNDGNIGIAIVNTSGTAVELKRGDRIAQGIFEKYLVSDNGNPDENVERKGGFGSSGK